MSVMQLLTPASAVDETLVQAGKIDLSEKEKKAVIYHESLKWSSAVPPRVPMMPCGHKVSEISNVTPAAPQEDTISVQSRTGTPGTSEDGKESGFSQDAQRRSPFFVPEGFEAVELKTQSSLGLATQTSVSTASTKASFGKGKKLDNHSDTTLTATLVSPQGQIKQRLTKNREGGAKDLQSGMMDERYDSDETEYMPESSGSEGTPAYGANWSGMMDERYDGDEAEDMLESSDSERTMVYGADRSDIMDEHYDGDETEDMLESSDSERTMVYGAN